MIQEAEGLQGSEDQKEQQLVADSLVPAQKIPLNVLQAKLEEAKRRKMELDLLQLDQENAQTANSLLHWEVKFSIDCGR